MANDFALLGSALYGRLGTVLYSYPAMGTAVTTGSVGVYSVMAPQSSAVETPYIIFQHQAGVDTYTFHDHGESLDYMVKAVSNFQTPVQAYAVYAGAHAAVQDAPLSLPNDTVLRVRRQSRFEFQDTDGYWHVGGLYRIDWFD